LYCNAIGADLKKKNFYIPVTVFKIYLQVKDVFGYFFLKNIYFFFIRYGPAADVTRMPPVEERAELGGYHAGPWSLGTAYKPGHASRQLLVEEGMLLFSSHAHQGAEQQEEEAIKPFKSVISNIDYFVGESQCHLFVGHSGPGFGWNKIFINIRQRGGRIRGCGSDIFNPLWFHPTKY
jgi:hypothetical protein